MFNERTSHLQKGTKKSRAHVDFSILLKCLFPGKHLGFQSNLQSLLASWIKQVHFPSDLALTFVSLCRSDLYFTKVLARGWHNENFLSYWNAEFKTAPTRKFCCHRTQLWALPMQFCLPWSTDAHQRLLKGAAETFPTKTAKPNHHISKQDRKVNQIPNGSLRLENVILSQASVSYNVQHSWNMKMDHLFFSVFLLFYF